MRKSVKVILGGLVVLALAASVAYAETPAQNGGWTCPRGVKMTEAQQQEMAPLREKMQGIRQQMLEVRKEALAKQVKFGNLTQEQADQMTKRMEERVANGGQGRGMGLNCGGGRHQGKGGGWCGNGQGGQGQGRGQGWCGAGANNQQSGATQS